MERAEDAPTAPPLHVVSLFDHTTLFLQPFALEGPRVECFAYDILNDDSIEHTASGCRIHRVRADLEDPATLDAIVARHGGRCLFASAFPPCTELSIAGAGSWKRKAAVDPDFQLRAVRHIRRVDEALQELDCPYFIENPAHSRLGAMWRRPTTTFEPFHFGAYLPESDVHPLYPDLYPARDRYSKCTGLWTGGGFALPPLRPLEPEWKHFTRFRHSGKHAPKRVRCSPIMCGSSRDRFKRSATPRGFSAAVALEATRACRSSPRSPAAAA